MVVRDDIGRRGERIFEVLITRFCGRTQPLFHPLFLGEKTEGVDYLVLALNAHGITPFFFVQVRATRLGYPAGGRRLRASISGAQIRRLARLPAPVYLAGIDEEAEVGYMVYVDPERRTGLSGVPTWFPLDCEALPRLWTEVQSYWTDVGRPKLV